MKNSINIDELKVIQLDILDNIHTFCKNNNIVYSIACGTAIGAVRHKGYIPWDDDIDIYMLRADYNKFIKSFPEINDVYSVASLERNVFWDRPYAKAYDTRTILIENDDETEHIGIGIDIFPIDKVPENRFVFMLYHNSRKIFQFLFALISANIDNKRGKIKNSIIRILRLIIKTLSKRRYAQFLQFYSQIFNGSSSKFVYENCQGLSLLNSFRKDIFNNLVDVSFENHSYKLFAEYDEYLKSQYGDYMQLPPVEKRVTTHTFTAFWKE